eukprot:Gb_13210 [translate_table: standard]
MNKHQVHDLDWCIQALASKMDKSMPISKLHLMGVFLGWVGTQALGEALTTPIRYICDALKSIHEDMFYDHPFPLVYALDPKKIALQAQLIILGLFGVGSCLGAVDVIAFIAFACFTGSICILGLLIPVSIVVKTFSILGTNPTHPLSYFYSSL